MELPTLSFQGQAFPLENAAIASSSLTWAFQSSQVYDVHQTWGLDEESGPVVCLISMAFAGPGRCCNIQPAQEGPGMPIHNFEFSTEQEASL